MMFALGAAGSLIDALSSLTSSKSSSATRSASQTQGANPFDLSGGTQTQATTGFSGTARGPSISPQTMSALIEAQSQSGATTAPADPADALKDLFSQIDADGDGSITKSEFENALGAGGTNTAAADDVFGKLDTDGDGTVSAKELASALQGGHHKHHHAHAASSTDSLTSTDSSTDPNSTDANGIQVSGLINVTDKLKLQPIDISQLKFTAIDTTNLLNTSVFDVKL
jgi:hypothetical protein